MQNEMKLGKPLTGETLVQLRNVSVAFEDETILSNIDFSLSQGDSVLLLGPSGCGKSTLAFVIAGLIPKSIEGEVEGEIWLHDSLKKPGGVGVVFQDPESQFCMLHVDDEVAFGLENLAVDPSDMDVRIDSALERFELYVDKHAQSTTLSGGMKQKLALACAFALEPNLYILDEPTANLDPYASSLVFEEVRKMCAEGRTVIVIEHKFDQLLDVMKRVVLFDRNGNIHRIGDTYQVIREEWDWMIEQGIIPAWQTPPWTERPTPAIRGKSKLLHTGNERSERSMLTRGSLLEVKDARIAYASKYIWDQPVSFTIGYGEFVAIVGKNGAGKSSLLQACMGLQELAAGEILLEDTPLRKWKRKEIAKQIAYVFQNPEHQFIFERVIDELSNKRVTDEPAPNLLAQLERFGLLQHQLHNPFALSQGQKRRLSVASMLLHDHELYLLDEPTFGQDAKTQEVIMEELHALHQMGKTIVMTTHDMDLVNRYATMVLVLDETGLLFEGTPSDLFQEETILRKAHLHRPYVKGQKGEHGIWHSYIG